MNRSRLSWLLLGVVVLVLGAGVYHLFSLRFSAGDVYPPYSSLRADPLGTKALYESLDDLPGLELKRNYEPLRKLTQAPRQTVLLIGVAPARVLRLQSAAATKLEALPAKGDRLVLALRPVMDPPRAPKSQPAKPPPASNDDADETDDEEEEEMDSFTNRWSFALGYLPTTANLPAKGPWHTLAYFTKLDSEWNVLERFRGNPVLIERPFRGGTLVLCADSYLFSNEALRQDRQTDLITRIVGGNRRVVFDETHHGVMEQPGIMTLARRYRLHGLFAGLLLLAVLYIWKNAVPFVPPYDEAHDARQAATGKHAAAGFVNLLRRSLPVTDLVPVCFEEWKKSCGHLYRRQPGKLAEAEAMIANQQALPPRQRTPVAAYRAIAEILQRRRKP